jgi:hypothetical protein
MVMTLRKRRRILIMVNLLLSVVLVGIGSALVLIPVDEPSGRQVSGKKAVGLSKIMPPVNEPLSAYAAICQRELRKPLFDSKPSAVSTAKAPPPKPQLTVTLTGTVIEPGFTYAMLRGKSGQVKFVSVGQAIDDAEVTEITPNSVTVKFHGDSITLKVNKGER